MKLQRKKQIWIGAGLALLLALAVWSILLMRGGRREVASYIYEEWEVKESQADARLLLRGVLQTSQMVVVNSYTRGAVTELAPQGALVHKGDVLCRIDPSNARETIENHEDDLNSTELRLEQLRARKDLIEFQEDKRIKQGQAKLEFARLEEKEELAKPDARDLRLMEIEERLAELDVEDALDSYEREKRMLEKGFITQSALEPYEQALENARAVREELLLKNQIERKGITDERRVELRKAVERAESDLARRESRRERRLAGITTSITQTEMELQRIHHVIEHAQEEIDKSTICAPCDGVFMLHTYRDWRNGGVLRELVLGDERYPFDIIGHIIDPQDMVVKFVVNEADYQRLSIGMLVDVTLPALPGRHFRGKLTTLGAVGKDRGRIDPTALGTGDSEVMMFNASISLQGEGTRFHPGMSALISVKLGKTQKGLFLPREAVVWNEGRPSVRLAVSGKLEAVEGQNYNDMLFLATGGIQAGERILIARPRQK